MAYDRWRDYRSALLEAADSLRDHLRDAPAGSGDTPYLDALVLLAHAAGITKERLIASFTDPLPRETAACFESLIAERSSGTPVSYIRRLKEFFGREFSVGPGVLVPRPETELLVEAAMVEIDAGGGRDTHTHDCCTGTGCVAITLALERQCTVTASELSTEAITYARANAEQLGVPGLPIWQGDLLSPLTGRLQGGETVKPHIITANPPYVADNEVDSLTQSGWPEPALALAGGPDGLDLVRRLVEDAKGCLAEGGCLLVEIGSEQGEATVRIFQERGFAEVSLVQDLAGRDRVCRGRWYRR